MALAAGLLAAALLLLVALPGPLARAAWPARSPGLALLLWQALGLAGGLLAVELALTVALAPVAPTHLQALGDLPADVPLWSGVALAAGAFLLLRLLTVLLASTAATLQTRRDHRRLVDLVATRNPLLAGARVVDHELPVAYCLPGVLRPRVVLSRGVLALLREEEVRAVVAHEAAHVEQRHDLVVLPFVALAETLPRLRAVRTAQDAVALLVELLADDRAARRHPPAVLARALYKVAAGPAGALSASGGDVLLRARRLLEPPAPLRPPARAAVVAAVVGVLALPPLGLLLPLLQV